MPGFLPSEVKNYQYAANIVYDELIDKFGMNKIPKHININKIRQAVELAKSKGLTPAQAAERVYNSAEKHIQGVKKMPISIDKLKAKRAEVEKYRNFKYSKDPAIKRVGQQAEKIAKDFDKKHGVESIEQAVKKHSVETSLKQGSMETAIKNLQGGEAKAASKLAKYGKIAGGLALATTLIYASYQVYKRNFSVAARACSGKTGGEKLSCIDKYRSNARKEQIKKLKQGLKYCVKTKDPISCKKAILVKIQKVSKKI